MTAPPSRRPTPGFLVWRLSMKWRAAVDRAVAPLGITHAQYSLLASLRGIGAGGAGAPSQRELADITGLEPLYVSKLARALETAGFVERSAHPTDTRVVQLALTELGVDTIDRAVVIVNDLLDRLTAPLGGNRGTATAAFARDVEALLANPFFTEAPEGNEP